MYPLSSRTSLTAFSAGVAFTSAHPPGSVRRRHRLFRAPSANGSHRRRRRRERRLWVWRIPSHLEQLNDLVRVRVGMMGDDLR